MSFIGIKEKHKNLPEAFACFTFFLETGSHLVLNYNVAQAALQFMVFLPPYCLLGLWVCVMRPACWLVFKRTAQ